VAFPDERSPRVGRVLAPREFVIADEHICVRSDEIHRVVHIESGGDDDDLEPRRLRREFGHLPIVIGVIHDRCPQILKRGGCHEGSKTGRVTMNSAPPSSPLAIAVTEPPRSVAESRTIVRPSPVPRSLVVCPGSQMSSRSIPTMPSPE